LAEIVPTWAIWGLHLLRAALDVLDDGRHRDIDSALEIHRIHSGGDELETSLMIEAVSTVAVVVPSPALSLAFEATSRTIWAPIFSNLSSSSIRRQRDHRLALRAPAQNDRAWRIKTDEAANILARSTPRTEILIPIPPHENAGERTSPEGGRAIP
jgi:hypothetical protein